ncbi:hypothetical protein [Nocardia sp. NBC_00511]|uniref:hypothetical protein n=1 Tax=Nocardia sp. NBC_00511 TaxID=2903591 RepID=UPI0030DE320C
MFRKARSFVFIFSTLMLILGVTAGQADSQVRPAHDTYPGYIGSTLATNSVMSQNQYLSTGTGTGLGGPDFAILQGDGNLCLYRGADPSQNQGGIWCSNTSGHSQVFAIMQGDGNFVIYKGTGPGNNQGYLWGTGAHSGGSPTFGITGWNASTGAAAPNIYVETIGSNNMYHVVWSS